jgi:very-short-patch-repair endonuclease
MSLKTSNTIGFKNARELRKSSTEAEAVLWNHLRNRNFLDLKFRRQHPLKSYIADFYCHELLLVIEIDGAYHNTDQQKDLDEERTKDLNTESITIYRITNEDVLYKIDQTLDGLKTFINSLKSPLL